MSVEIPVPPPKNPRQRRHSTATVVTARRMYGDGDSWTPGQIAAYLTSRGTQVTENTVRGWVQPSFADRMREMNRESARRRKMRAAAETPPQVAESELSATPVLDRMLALRGAGLSFPSVAKVINLDMGIEISAPNARYYVNTRREPRLPKRRARTSP